jgi:hypothetical protein
VKKIVSFAMPQKNPEKDSKLVREFAEGDVEGFELDQCIFSTAYNRNHAYFQVSSLTKWANKLERILFNFNHDLTQSGGQYLGNKTKAIKMWSVELDGEYEVWWTIRSTDELMIQRRNEITGPSVELLVDSENIIKNELGEYYRDFDFVGCAQLTGVLAGSGDSRNTSEVREFNLDLTPINQNIMQEQQVKELLEAQKTELQKEFSDQIETIKSEFASQTAELLSKSQTKTNGTMSWVNSDGDTITEDWESIYTSIVTKTKNENPTVIEVMEYLAENYGIKSFKIDSQDGNNSDNPPSADSSSDKDNGGDADAGAGGAETLEQIEMQLNHADNLKNKMKTESNFDLVPDQNGADKSAKLSKEFKQLDPINKF